MDIPVLTRLYKKFVGKDSVQETCQSLPKEDLSLYEFVNKELVLYEKLYKELGNHNAIYRASIKDIVSKLSLEEPSSVDDAKPFIALYDRYRDLFAGRNNVPEENGLVASMLRVLSDKFTDEAGNDFRKAFPYQSTVSKHFVSARLQNDGCECTV